MRLTSLFNFAIFVLTLSAVPADADIVWNYDTNDGANKSITGQLTTTGDPADLLIANTFNLISIDTVTIFNSATFGLLDLNTGVQWKGGVAPPFSTSPSGSINWDPVTMTVTQNQNFLLARAVGGLDQVGIGNAAGPNGDTSFVAYFPDPSPGIFTPWIGLNPTRGTTTFTPATVPEPSALGALFGVAAAGLSRRRRQR